MKVLDSHHRCRGIDIAERWAEVRSWMEPWASERGSTAVSRSAHIITTWLISHVFHVEGTFRPSSRGFILSLLSIPWSPVPVLSVLSSLTVSLWNLRLPCSLSPLLPLLYLSILDPQRGQGDSRWVDRPLLLLLSFPLTLSSYFTG